MEQNYFGVHIPISYFTRNMNYYSFALPYLILYREIKDLQLSEQMSLDCIKTLLDRLNRKYVIYSNYIIDCTTDHSNICATFLGVVDDKINYVKFRDNIHSTYHSYDIIKNKLDTNVSESDVSNIDRIVQNTKLLVEWGKKPDISSIFV